MTNAASVPKRDNAALASNQAFVSMGSGDTTAMATRANGAGWDNNVHQNQGNACMGDGSVQQLSAARLREQLRNSGTSDNRFSFPGSAK